jgi:hypothetical protein
MASAALFTLVLPMWFALLSEAVRALAGQDRFRDRLKHRILFPTVGFDVQADFLLAHSVSHVVSLKKSQEPFFRF